MKRLELSKRGRQDRNRVAARDGGMRCAYCRAAYDADQLVLEHIFPRARCGPDALWNRVLACQPCDGAKGCRLPQEWLPGVVFDNPWVDNPGSEGHIRVYRAALAAGRVADRAPAAVMVNRVNVDVMARDVGRRTARLRSTPFEDLRFCATCQRHVSTRQDHPRGHLVIKSGRSEPGAQGHGARGR